MKSIIGMQNTPYPRYGNCFANIIHEDFHTSVLVELNATRQAKFAELALSCYQGEQ